MTQEEMIVKIGMALGSGGRTFTTEDVVKVCDFINNAMVKMALSYDILEGRIHVGIDKDGEIAFSDDPAKFS